MLEFLVLFSLAATGSSVCLTADLALKFFARKAHGATMATGPGRGASASSPPQADPVLTFGFTLACYGAISLALISALPGALALERTCLTFAILCVGGLINEIAGTTATGSAPSADTEEDTPVPSEPLSPRLAVVLTLVLNVAFAVASAGQGLIHIVPPAHTAGTVHPQEMDPIIVVAQRTDDPLDRHPEAL